MSSAERQKILSLSQKTKLNHLEVPQGDDLFTDYFFTSEKKEKCLVYLSGVHGVEGHLGSLILQEIIQENLEKLPFQLVLVHTVNPYGLANEKRTNAANVDLNRNSLKEYKIENPYHQVFYPFLKSGKFSDFVKTIPVIAKIGIDQTAIAVACGQTEFPDSLFYSGKERQPELVSLKKNLEFLIDRQSEVFVMDIHTGLGKLGEESLFYEGSSENATKLQNIFNKKLTIPGKARGFHPARGTLAQLFRESWKSTHCFQEFGTKPFYQVLSALRHQQPEQMLEAFFPSNPEWRKRCIGLGLLRFQQLVQNLS